jgi:hypothetical protein
MAIDLKTLAGNAVNVAFDTASQATSDVILRTNPNTSGVYDPVTGKYTGNSPTEFAVKGIVYQSRDQKLAEDAAKTSMVLIRISELEAQGFTGVITDSDYVVIDGVAWSVSRADTDPIGVTWQLAIRK